MESWKLFFENLGIDFFWLRICLGFVFSFILVYISIPVVIKISRKKNLMDEPVDRSSHQQKIPNLGGVSIFYAIAICASIFAYELFESYKFLFSSLVILLYIGIMDDIIEIRAYKKLMVQIIVSFLIVVGSDLRIDNLQGVLGIGQLNYLAGVILTVATFIILINSFNLIDGIDGLAGGYSVFACTFFGWSFFHLGQAFYPLGILSLIIAGAVLAFLCYNLSEKRKIKIFMGDTGSMILGFLMVFLTVSFIDIFEGGRKGHYLPNYYLPSAPVIAVTIFIFPIIDTLNVILVRLSKGTSPLQADKNHIHHKLLALGFSHKKSSLLILVYYVLLVFLVYFLRGMNNNLLLLLVLVLGFFGAYLPNLVMKFRKNIIDTEIKQ